MQYVPLLSALHHLSVVFFACLVFWSHHIREPRVVADRNTTCCNCSLHRVFVDLGTCRNSGGRSFGGFFGVCDAVSCILSSTGSFPFSFLRKSSSSSSSSSSYFLIQNQLDLSHRLMIGVFFFPDFLSFFW